MFHKNLQPDEHVMHLLSMMGCQGVHCVDTLPEMQNCLGVWGMGICQATQNAQQMHSVYTVCIAGHFVLPGRWPCPRPLSSAAFQAKLIAGHLLSLQLVTLGVTHGLASCTDHARGNETAQLSCRRLPIPNITQREPILVAPHCSRFCCCLIFGWVSLL